MLDFRPAAIVRRVRSLLESRTTSFWVLGSWIALTLVWVVPFQLTGQPQTTVNAIAENWLVFRVVYSAVALTTLLCTWSRISRDLRRLQDDRPVPVEPTAEAILVSGYDLADVERMLSDDGYTVRVADGALHGSKHRYSLLGGSVLHFGVVLLGLAIVVNALTIDSVTLRVTEGQGLKEAATAAGVPALPARLRDLTLYSIEPRYYEDVLLFTHLEAQVEDASGARRSFSLSRPYWIGPTTLLSIADYDLAPHIRVIDDNGPAPVTKEYFVAMSLASPGSEDEADIPAVPLDISLIAYPDHGVVNGRDVSLSYNIANPAFVISLREEGRNGRLLARKLVAIDEAVTANYYTVSISDLSRYGTFRLTTAPALPFVALSLLLLSVGAAWRFMLRRSTALVWQGADGLLIDAWRDLAGRDVARDMLVEKLRKAGTTE